MGNEYAELPRDPVDVAELERDLEETFGSSEQQLQDYWEHQQNQADMEYGDED